MTDSEKKNSPESTTMEKVGCPRTKTPPPFREVPLTDGMTAIVDEDDYEKVSKFKWEAQLFKCSYYAVTFVRKGNRVMVLRMHRLIAKTPPMKCCHHINHNSLDNRKANLLNLTSQEHTDLHLNNSLIVKYAKPHPG